MTRKCSDSGANTWYQLSPPVATQPCNNNNVGAPGGPESSRTNVVPRCGNSMCRPGGSAVTAAAIPPYWHDRQSSVANECETVDAVGDRDDLASGDCGIRREHLAHFVEHDRALGFGKHRHVAHRCHALHDAFGCDLLFVLKLSHAFV